MDGKILAYVCVVVLVAIIVVLGYCALDQSEKLSISEQDRAKLQKDLTSSESV